MLPGGNVLVGFGGAPWFTEYSKIGDELLDARLPDPDISYRAYLQSWAGLPLTPPSGAARSHGSRSTVYASWNGATQLSRWAVLAGHDGRHLAPVATRARAGFETAITLGHRYRAFRLLALNAGGSVIGRSKVFGAGRVPAQNFPPAGY
jgi:hypothetical protein